MNKGRKKKININMLLFVLGLIVYLTGLILLFSASLGHTSVLRNLNLTTKTLNILKITGGFLFIIGFIIFILSVISLYKNNCIQESNTNLIIEGKADVITLIIMTYIMMFMMAICLLYNELIGALLFGITIVTQSIINSILIGYFSKNRM